ncbi:MAG: phosphate ABC transporter substrate-binding protein PstS [Rhizobacter sp.]
MIHRFGRTLVFILAVTVTIGAQAQRVKGAGSSFAAALYSDWGDQFAKPLKMEMSYSAIGSSGGVKRIIDRSVDFGASDRPLNRKDLETNSLAQFPTAVGAVVIVTNVPGIPSERIRLSGPVLADIYSGTIKNWNHPAIAALNQELSFPSLAIIPVHRSDGSGSSYVLTSYLSKVSSEFASKVGVTSNLSVVGGRAAPSNREIVVTVQGTTGAIGYTDYSFTSELGISTAQVKNRWGIYVSATAKSMQDAVRMADWELMLIDQDPTFEMDLADAPCPSCWPIASVTYVLVPLKTSNINSSWVIDLFEAALSEGDATAIANGYVPLPSRAKSIVKLSMRRWQSTLERNGAGKSQRRSEIELQDNDADNKVLLTALRY